ncbi:hypothetical protein [Streptacidiphilus sp. PAMC 29251]
MDYRRAVEHIRDIQHFDERARSLPGPDHRAFHQSLVRERHAILMGIREGLAIRLFENGLSDECTLREIGDLIGRPGLWYEWAFGEQVS